MKSCLAITLALISCFAFSQNVDSLFTKFQQSKGKAGFEIANKFSQTLFDQQYITKEQTLSESGNQEEIEAFMFSNMGRYYSRLGKYEESIELYEEGMRLYKSIEDSLNICRILQNLYVSYSVVGNMDKAFSCLEESYPIALALNNDKYIAYGQLALGDFYFRNDHFTLAEEYFLKAYTSYKKTDNTQMAVAALERLNTIYWEADKWEQIDSVVKEVQYWKTKELDQTIKLTVYMIEAQAYKKPGEWDKALMYLDSCLEISEAEGLVDYSIAILTQISEVHILNEQPQKAEDVLVRTIELCLEYDRQTVLHRIYRQLYGLNKDRNQVQALKYLELFTILNDTIHNQQMQEQLADFHVRYETVEKEAQINIQRAKLQKQNIQRKILFMGLILSVFFLGMLWYILRLRIKRNRVLAEMNATKDKFFSIISHDLKNPAIAQRDALQLLMNSVGKWDVELLTQYYSELLKSADSQVELLYNLLNWAQVQTGRMPYAPRQFDLATALRSDITLIENMAKRKGIFTDIRIPQTAIVTGDSNMITTTIRNLLTNAVKFTPADNAVSLHIKPTAGATYTISVIDTGTGMDSEQLCNLFRIEYQHSRRGTNGEAGSGMGLSVCKELIEKHGSTLNVESEEGKGSHFWFTLNK